MPPRAPNPTPLPGPPRGLTGVELSRWIIDTCTRSDAAGGLGFTAAGVCAADAVDPSDAKIVDAWLSGQQHGDMAYMREQLGERLDPQRVLPGVRSVVMVADRYAPRDGGEDARADAESAVGTPRGTIARYARGRDYHTVIKRRLHRLADALRAGGSFPSEGFVSFTDTAPVFERRFAQRAGLGWLAKNAMLIHPVHGSYLLLGGFFTTLDLPPLPEQEVHTDHCGTCTRCIDACPTGAIARQPLDGGSDPRPRVNGSRCISYLTIEHEGVIAPALAEKTGDWAFGCDICQEVCPHNSVRPSLPDAPVRSEYAPARATLPLLEMLGWQAGDRSLLTVSAMKRATAEMFRRNAVIALANGYSARPDPAVLEALSRASQDESPLVRAAARNALASTSDQSEIGPEPRSGGLS